MMVMDAQAIRDRLTYEVPALKDEDQRLRELIVYIAGKFLTCEFFGVVKLNKTLFHSDMLSFRRYGEAITGSKYKKDERGPVPVRILPVQRQMEGRSDIRVVPEDMYGLTQRRIVPLRKPNLTLFSGRDIAIVDEVIQALWSKTGTQVSEESHGVQWNTRALGDLIPYEASYLSDEPITPADVERTTVLAKKYGWAAA
ncbi:MAG: Panacea domain-containing protein [Stellaceae bacterium]